MFIIGLVIITEQFARLGEIRSPPPNRKMQLVVCWRLSCRVVRAFLRFLRFGEATPQDAHGSENHVDFRVYGTVSWIEETYLTCSATISILCVLNKRIIY